MAWAVLGALVFIGVYAWRRDWRMFRRVMYGPPFGRRGPTP